MATSQSWTEANSNPSIASVADSRARTFRRPENVPVSRALAAAFGLNSPASLGFFDPDSYSLRTFQACLFETQCPEWSESWPDSGMWDLGSVYELQTSGPAICESGCSLWPTHTANPATYTAGNAPGYECLPGMVRNWPTASASIANDGETPESWKARQQRNIEKHYNGNGMGTPLTIAVSTWPTPNVPNGGRTTSTSNYDANGNKRQIDLGAVAKLWPTPHQNATTGPGAQGRDGGLNLQTAADTWTTPQAHDSSAGNPERVGRFGTEHGGRNLADDVTLWQTPAADSFRSWGGERKEEMGLDQQARFFPTPSARDWKSEQGLENRTSQHAPNLSQFVYLNSLPAPLTNAGPPSCANGLTSRRRLNPRFVEWLLGFPIRWTEL